MKPIIVNDLKDIQNIVQTARKDRVLIEYADREWSTPDGSRIWVSILEAPDLIIFEPDAESEWRRVAKF